MPRLFAFAISSLSLLANASAQIEDDALGQFEDDSASVATLVSEVKTIAPGTKFNVALKLDHPEGWHSYYQNSGDIEQTPAIKWTLPAGFSAGPIQWPVPHVKDGSSGKSFVYESPVFLVEITAPATLDSGKTITLTADASWQICSESGCKNEPNPAEPAKPLTLNLPTGAASEKDPAAAALFDKARAALPVMATDLKFSTSTAGQDILLRVEPAGGILPDNFIQERSIGGSFKADPPVDFIPDQPFVKSLSSGGSIKRDGNAWLIQLKRATKLSNEIEIPQGKSFSGILIGPRPVLVPETAILTTSSAPVSLPLSKYLPILGGMLLGGLILNLMPCVFPVIGLKIMGFVQQAGADRKKVALHGAAFTVGVLASFGVISGILFAARTASGGDSVGWGYQLQNPWVVLTLMLLMFVLALNMFGLFELGTSATSVGGSLQAKQGLGGSFFSGVLATVVATPCSAPFLGVAIGAAIGLPAFQFFAAFAAMGIGLSLPYLILSVFPRLIDFLPRPGAWMESFKQAMSFFLFVTAGYLLWVYAGQIGLDNLLGPIFGLGAIAVAAWIYGRWNLPHRPQRTRWTAMALTLLFAAAGFILAKPPQKSALVWEHWSQERVDELTAKGTPVYIDFTAQWCATCQVNKRTAYTKEIVELMKKKGVVALKADKTNPDAKIEAKLKELSRTAIPVNVLIMPGKDPVITPEVLRPDYLKDLFTKEIPGK